MKPAVFVATTFDSKNPLPGAASESQVIFEPVTDLGWKAIMRHKPNIETITAEFGKSLEYSYRIFHFAGHAKGQELQFNDRIPTLEELTEAESSTANYWLGAEGLAQILAAQKTVQLVILNGCSTNEQAEIYRKAKIPAVIFSTMPLKDSLGRKFAEEFYKSFFKGNSTLQAAFDVAAGAIKAMQNNLPDQGFDPQLHASLNRGAFVLNDFKGKPLYQLSADEDFKQKTLQNWEGASAAATQPLPVPKTHFVSEESIWRCDRSDQVFEFEMILKNLAENASPEPLFLFVHEHRKACPLGLAQRFEVFGFEEFCEGNAQFRRDSFLWKSINLPKRGYLVRPDLCRSALFDAFDRHYATQTDTAKGRRAFRQALQPDLVLVLQHDLGKSDVKNGADLKILMDFYLGDFSRILAAELSARVAVIFTLEYYEEKNDFQKLFAGLEKRHKTRVKNLTAMPAVLRQEVGNWVNLVFERKPNPPDVNDLFPADAAGDAAEMASIAPLLKAAVDKYNRPVSVS
ncbi:MAG: CHAT domain-containing protein [Bacteroidota bacterium]|mgnify:CR=1 FL=1